MAIDSMVGTKIQSALACMRVFNSTGDLVDDQLMADTIHYARCLPDWTSDVGFGIGDEVSVRHPRDKLHHKSKGIFVGVTAKLVHIALVPIFINTLVLKIG